METGAVAVVRSLGDSLELLGSHAEISILGFSTQSLTSLHILHIEVQVVRDLSHKHGLVAGGALLLFQHRQHLLYRLLLVVGPDLWE